MLVHGGAGELRADARSTHEAGCKRAVERASELLARGASAVDAVECAVNVLEDDPHFNAATGASLTAAGRLELDAAIMEGQTLRAGAVCCLGTFRHPVSVARRVLDDDHHVLYSGEGADAYALRAGFERVAEQKMITEEAKQRLHAALAKHNLLGSRPRFGDTVGAVARDTRGNLAAATSTGGLSGKHPGRIGDSPIIGAGIYADDAVGAASATGHGEGILRLSLAARVMEALRAGSPPDQAALDTLRLMEAKVSSRGGLIVLSRSGALGLARTTPAMSWAAAWAGAELQCGS